MKTICINPQKNNSSLIKSIKTNPQICGSDQCSMKKSCCDKEIDAVFKSFTFWEFLMQYLDMANVISDK